MRDYGIDLAERIDGMSWRQFANLARNLSPFGAVAARAQALRGETAEAEPEAGPEEDAPAEETVDEQPADAGENQPAEEDAEE